MALKKTKGKFSKNFILQNVTVFLCTPRCDMYNVMQRFVILYSRRYWVCSSWDGHQCLHTLSIGNDLHKPSVCSNYCQLYNKTHPTFEDSDHRTQNTRQKMLEPQVKPTLLTQAQITLQQNGQGKILHRFSFSICKFSPVGPVAIYLVGPPPVPPFCSQAPYLGLGSARTFFWAR